MKPVTLTNALTPVILLLTGALQTILLRLFAK
jgi:hypothetical protein